MRNFINTGFFFFWLVLPQGLLLAQAEHIDSVKNVIEITKNDSLKIEALHYVGRLISRENLAQSIPYLQQAVDLCDASDYPVLKMEVVNSMGIVYYGLGNYEMTLECFYEILAFHEKSGDSAALANIYNNVGLIWKEMERPKEALEFFEKSLKLKLENDLSTKLASSYVNMGLTYHDLIKDYKKAAIYYKKALALDRANLDYYGLFYDLGNLGINYFKTGELDSAQNVYDEAIMLMDKIDDRYVKAELLCQMGELQAARGFYDRAIEKHTLSLNWAETAGAKFVLKSNYKSLSNIYSLMGNYKRALEYHKKFSDIEREIFNEDKNKKIAAIENTFQFQFKENEIELLKKEAEIKDLTISNRATALYWLVGILLLVAFIVVLQYRKNVYRDRTNAILRQQNAQIIMKNENIMDSILYAKNIQESILPEDGKLKSVFQDAFVFSRPRDVVNGDFYWFAEERDMVIIAAVDCTGHGVPAAFLNVMGNSLLNQIVNEEKILAPAAILKELNIRIYKALKYNDLRSNRSTDGMDIGICLFDRSSRALTFAGAKRPLYYFHNRELQIVKGDPYPIGGILYNKEREYHQHELTLQAEDSIYLFTDGIVDQFGGESNKKYMYPRFRKLLKGLASESMANQMAAIEKEISLWQGSNEQTDDILLIGLRV